jgi:predicted metalloendopeptidase
MIDWTFVVSSSQISTAPEDRRDHRKSTVTMTAAQLKKEVGSWIFELLNNVFKKINSTDRISLGDSVTVLDLEYMKEVRKILEEIPDEIIQNYQMWRILQRIGYLSIQEFRQNEFEFKKVQQGIEKPLDMDKRCIEAVSDTMPDLLGRTYVDYFFTVEEKKSAEVMIDAILDAFKIVIHEKEWMDQPTRKQSLLKANKIKVNTGYPEWIKDDKQLESMYNFGEPASNTINAIVDIFKVLTKKMFDKLRKPVEADKEWPMGSSTVNAAYDPAQNSISKFWCV